MATKSHDCMYAVPHELTGIGTVCGLFKNACNGKGRRCIAYRKHTPESRKALKDAIERAKAEKEGEARDGTK